MMSGYQGKESVGARRGGARSRRSVGLGGARPVRPQPHPARARQEARPARRARARDRARDAGALAAHEEQPRPHRRAGRRQDRDRRGPRPADRLGQRARSRWPTSRSTRSTSAASSPARVPRRLRGAPEEGAEGDPHARRHHLVHRRDPHARRCRRRGGRDRRGQHPQADARARRAADDRGHDARRVPQAHREGRRPGAPVPAGQGRAAQRVDDHRHPEGPPRPLRGAPRGDDHRPGARRRGEPRRPVHLGPLPARQGDRPDRRGRAAGCGSAACPRRRRRAQLDEEIDRLRADKEAAIERGAMDQAKRLAEQELERLDRKTAHRRGVPRGGQRDASTSSTRRRSPRCSRRGRASPSTG